MAKFYGIIGFECTRETQPGVWETETEERKYCGDMVRQSFKYQQSQNLNDNVTISNQISIITDTYANDFVSQIKYVKVKGIKWKVNNIEIQYPRLLLTLGDVYNG